LRLIIEARGYTESLISRSYVTGGLRNLNRRGKVYISGLHFGFPLHNSRYIDLSSYILCVKINASYPKSSGIWYLRSKIGKGRPHFNSLDQQTIGHLHNPWDFLRPPK